MDFFSIDIDGVSLVSGLEWRALTGLAKPLKEIRENASEIEAALFVDMKTEQETLCGFLPNERRADLPKKAHSLPVVLAGVPNISSDCVLVIEDGEVAVIAALRDGAPAPGFDGYGATEEIIALARDFINMAPAGVTVYGNSALLDAMPLSLEDIVAQSTTVKQAVLRGIPNPWASYILLTLLIAGLSVGCYEAYKYKKAQDLKRQQQLTYVNPDVEYHQKIDAELKQIPAAKPTFRLLKQSLGLTVPTNGGWGLSDILCQKDGCTYTWKNEMGTNKSFVLPKNATNVLFASKGDKLTYQIGYSQPLPTGLRLEGSLLPTPSVLNQQIVGSMQELQDFKVEQSFDDPQPYMPAGMTGAPTKQFKVGEFTVSGPLYAFDVLEKLPDATAFESLDVKISAEQHISFKATGKYYVK